MSDAIDWPAVLRVSLSDWLRIGFILFGAAANNNGFLSRNLLLDQSKFRLVYGSLSPSNVVEVVDLWFASPIERMVKDARDAVQSNSSIWDYNVLFERPLVMLNDENYVIPSPRGVLTRIGPMGLYFIGRDAIDSTANEREFRSFTSLLGKRFEKYIGEQLKLIRYADVRPEITYEGSKKSVDFLIETPEVIVLVEAKSAAPTAATRAGSFPDGGDIDSRLQDACGQIERSATLIRSGHPAFPELNGRIVRGLIVTREQYSNLALPTMSELVRPQGAPTTIVSSQQLERALAVLANEYSAGEMMLKALGSDIKRIKFDLNEISNGANPILEKLFTDWNPFKDRSTN